MSNLTTPTIRTESHQRMLSRATNLVADGYTVREVLEKLYEVTNPAGQTYTVDLRDVTCTCKAFAQQMFRDQKGATCKHIAAIQTAERRAWVLANINRDF